MLQRTEQFLRREGMLPPKGGLVLCAVSGGLDSVSLLHFLCGLSKQENFRLTAAHYNHRLRGEASEGDAHFVEELCAEWGIPCVAGEGDVAAEAEEHGWSIEEAARNCRYAFLEAAADALGADRIATAHHAEDNAETVLLQLIRGSGSDGLGGIAPVRGRLIRPFLTVSRSEIEAYAKDNRLPHREDESNRDPAFTRNRLRREVIPLLQELSGGAVQAICRAAEVRREEGELLQRLAEAELGEVIADPEGVSALREYFRRTEPTLIPRMLGILLEAAGIGRKDVTARHFDAMKDLVLHGADGAELSLPGGRIWCAGEYVLLSCEDAATPEPTVLMPEDMVCWGDYFIALTKNEENFPENHDTIPLKYDMIQLPLSVSLWDRGQGMTIPGRPGQRSLKRLFAERGITPRQRDRAPVFYSAGKVCAAAGIGADAAFLPQEGEETIFLIIKKIERI